MFTIIVCFDLHVHEDDIYPGWPKVIHPKNYKLLSSAIWAHEKWAGFWQIRLQNQGII